MQELLIPVKKLKKTSGRFAWDPKPVLISPFAEDQLPLQQLAGTLKAECAIRARFRRDPSKDHTLIVRRSDRFSNLEAYRIDIAKDGIEVSARTSAGAYYAVQTLRGLIKIHGSKLPCCVITDEPDFWRRGIYLDCSRGKVPTIETLKLLVEYLGSIKINELQLYIENVFTFRSHPEIGRGFSPFTPEDILEVQDYCKLHHIRLVPSLTSFGHFEKILGLPAYSHLSEMAGIEGSGAGSTLCPGDRGSVKILDDMYGDFVPLFEAEDFNVCGDEPWELGKGRSRKRAEKVGLGRVYLDFIKKIHKLCEKQGKRMNLWGDIVLNHPEIIPDIPQDVTMLNWEYTPMGPRIRRTHEFANAGLNIVVCPGTWGWGTHTSRLQRSMDNVSGFARVGRKYEAEGLLNTDWGDGGHRNTLGVSFHGYAHGAAHAWHGRGVDDNTFTKTFCSQVLRTSARSVPELIRKAGAVEEVINESPYYALGGPIDGKNRYGKGFPRITPVSRRIKEIGLADDAGCRKVLRDLDGWQATLDQVKSQDVFAQVVREGLAVGVRMDELMCRKFQLAAALRSGKRVPLAQLDTLALDIGSCAEVFAEHWLKRNRVSRLKENLQLFKDNISELASIAGA